MIITLAAEPPLLIVVFLGILMLPSKYKTAVPEPENVIVLSFANPQSVYSKVPSTSVVEVKLPEGSKVGNGLITVKVDTGVHELLLHEFPDAIEEVPTDASE